MAVSTGKSLDTPIDSEVDAEDRVSLGEASQPRELAMDALDEHVVLEYLAANPRFFDDNPQEYIRRDIENADQDTRRRSAIDFVPMHCLQRRKVL